MPLALGVLWKMVKEVERSVEVYQMALDFDKVLSLDLDKQDEIPENIKKLADERLDARKNKDWALSDKLRDEIQSLGYQIKDSKDGYEITKI